MSVPSELLAAALSYQRRGWSVIPLDSPSFCRVDGLAKKGGDAKAGKRPLYPWKPYQALAASEEQVRVWWTRTPYANVGVIMGGVSGIVAWDVDDQAGAERLKEINGATFPPTWMFVTGGGGVRLLYRWPGENAAPPRHFATEEHSLTFLGEGSYSVFPPSRHHTGAHYVWLPKYGPEDRPLAPLTPNMVNAIIRQEAGDRQPAWGGGADGKAPPVYEYGRKMERARAWTRNFQPAIQGQGGRVVAFKLACSLIHGFGLHYEDAFLLMVEEWNERCSPPWYLDELFKRVESARDTGHWNTIPEKPYAERR